MIENYNLLYGFKGMLNLKRNDKKIQQKQKAYTCLIENWQRNRPFTSWLFPCF